MAHNTTEIYFDTIWSHLSEGLKDRILDAVTKPKKGGPKQSDVIVEEISAEHREEIEWMVVREDSGQGDAFIAVNVGSGASARAGLKLTDDMVHYVEDRILKG